MTVRFQRKFAIFAICWCVCWMLGAVIRLAADRSPDMMADVDGEHDYR